MAVIMPARPPLLVRRGVAVPDIFCDVAIVLDGAEVVRIMLAALRQDAPDAPAYHELVGRLTMPRSGFAVSYEQAGTLIVPAKRGPFDH